MSAVSTAACWLMGQRSLTADLDGLERKLAAHEAESPQSIIAADFARHRAAGDELRRAIDDTRAALAIATANAAAAEAAQREVDADAAHAAEEKAAKADAKLVRAVDDVVSRLATARDALAASVARTREFNKSSGRPPILDAEGRVRTIPAQFIPATYRNEVIWENSRGERPMVLRPDANGEMVPVDFGFTRKVISVEDTPEGREPPRMPMRYIEALALVDLAGKPI